MKQLQPYWFKPRHQRAGQPEVEFQLRPITQRTLMAMFADWKGNGPGPDGVVAAVSDAVIGWKGITQEYSVRARQELFDGVPDIDALLWAYEIAGKVFLSAQLKEDAAKNSESPST